MHSTPKTQADWYTFPWAICLIAPLALLTAPLLPATGDASHLTVPDDMPTVQAALNARPDTVLIRGGTYPETPLVSAPVVIVGIPGNPGPDRPTLLGLSFRLFEFAFVPTYSVTGVNIVGPVYLQNDDLQASFTFDHCDLLSGLLDQSGYLATYYVTLRGCRVKGDIFVRVEDTCTIDSCTVEGELTIGDGAASLIVTDSRFSGQGTGIGVHGARIWSATMVGTTVERFGTGIAISVEHTVSIQRNIVRDCPGQGMNVTGGGLPHSCQKTSLSTAATE